MKTYERKYRDWTYCVWSKCGWFVMIYLEPANLQQGPYSTHAGAIRAAENQIDFMISHG